MVLGNFPVPGRPTNLVDGKASAVGVGGGCYLFSSFSLSLAGGPI